MEATLQRQLAEDSARPVTDRDKMSPQQRQNLETLFDTADSAYHIDRLRRRLLLALLPVQLRKKWARAPPGIEVVGMMTCSSLDQPLLPQQQLRFNEFVHACWKGSGVAEKAALRLIIITMGCLDATNRLSSLMCLEAVVQLLRIVLASPGVQSDHQGLVRSLSEGMEAVLKEEEAAHFKSIPIQLGMSRKRA